MKNNFPYRSILLCVLSISLLLAACGTAPTSVAPASTATLPVPTASALAPTPTPPAPTFVPVKIKAAVPLNLSNSPLFIAQDEGFFAEQGLEVEFVTVASSARVVPSLISGEVDLAVGTITVGHLNAIAHETHIRIVADKGHYEAGQCVSQNYVVRPDFLAQHPINGPADLKGLKINVNMAANAGFTLELFLAQANLTVADVQIFTVDPSAELPALESGQIDIISLIDPSLSQEVNAGHVVALTAFDRSAVAKQVATVIFGASLVDKNPDAGKRFMVAYLKGVRQYNQGKTDRNLGIAAKYTQQDREVLKQACWQAINADGQIDVKSIVDFGNWAVKNNLLDVAVTPEQFWDPSFIDYANRVLQATP